MYVLINTKYILLSHVTLARYSGSVEMNTKPDGIAFTSKRFDTAVYQECSDVATVLLIYSRDDYVICQEGGNVLMADSYRDLYSEQDDLY